MAAAADNQKIGKAMARHNYVAQDQIWKDHVHHEETAAKSWPNNWNFLSKPYEELVKDEFPDHGKRKAPELPRHLQIPPVTPLEKLHTVHPSPKPYPLTTSNNIGWRSGTRTLALEKYGRYAKPKGALVRQLKWPNEAIS